MSTLRENLNLLLELQQVDTDRDKLARQRAALDSGDKLNATLTGARTKHDQLRAQLHKINGELKDAELELAGIEKKIRDYEAKMRQGSVTNTREVMNFEKEFNQLNRQRAQLDEKILNLMEESESQTTIVSSAHQKTADVERDLATLKDKFHGELSTLDAKCAQLNAKRSELSKLMADPALLKRYETLRSKPGNAGLAIAHTHENTCGACHMQIGTIAVTQAAGGDQLSICENCGRILA